MPSAPSEERVEEIRRGFKRCRPGTVEAIIDLQRNSNTELIPTIVRGIVWRYVRENARARLDQATAETALMSLGIDSLTMMEIILDVQDALAVEIDDVDLKQMKTIGDVSELLEIRYKNIHV